MTRVVISTGLMSRTLAAAAVAFLAACSADPLSLTASSLPASSQAPAEAGPEYVPGEVIVKFRAGASAAGRGAAMRAASAQAREHIVTAAMRRAGDNEGVTVLKTAINVPAAVQALRASPDVEYAEPNWIYRHVSVTPNDPFYADGKLWGMYGDGTTPTNPFGSQAGEAWNRSSSPNTGSASVHVGVIDEGIDYRHPDLTANIWTNPVDVAGDGVDNDGNGLVDDVHGWDFANGDNTVYDGTTSNSVDAHGTHVAGTIGATGNNGTGVVGVSWNVTMISGKFLGPSGGSLANAVKAIDYITDLKTRHSLNIVATNNSWGGGGFSQALLDAINRAGDAGILFIAAAGNGGFDGRGDDNDKRANYPSNYECTSSGKAYDCVIAVASITSSGAKSRFSNYGAKTVDLGAPGSDINSTLPNGTYGSYSGTSMATPHVTGGAALYAAANAGVSAAKIKSAIVDAARATPTSSLSGKTVTGGRLNVSGF